MNSRWDLADEIPEWLDCEALLNGAEIPDDQEILNEINQAEDLFEYWYSVADDKDVYFYHERTRRKMAPIAFNAYYRIRDEVLKLRISRHRDR